MTYEQVIGCMAKVVYPDYRAASFAAAAYTESNFGPYQCPVCSGYHLGHLPRSIRWWNKRMARRGSADADMDAREARFNASVERWKRGELADDVVREQRKGVAA